jgi:hypothetical protein
VLAWAKRTSLGNRLLAIGGSGGWKRMAQGWEGEERTRTFEANRATLEETSKCEKQAAQSVRGPSAM